MSPFLMESTQMRIAFVEWPKLPTCVTTPVSFATRPMSCASWTVDAIGFSTKTWMPRRMAMTAARAWWWFGVAMKTASISSPIFAKSSR